MNFRPLTSNDSSEIEKLFTTVFTDSEGEEEGRIVGNVARQLITSMETPEIDGYKAMDEEQIVGAIFFSRLTFKPPLEAFLLAPVAIHPHHQRIGLGKALITHGLQKMANRGVDIITTYGAPAFYTRVGFQPISPETIQPPHQLSQPEGWLGQSLTDTPLNQISGQCTCVKAFDNPILW